MLIVNGKRPGPVRMCLGQGYVSQQKFLEITQTGGLGSRVNGEGRLRLIFCC